MGLGGSSPSSPADIRARAGGKSPVPPGQLCQVAWLREGKVNGFLETAKINTMGLGNFRASVEVV